MARIGLYGGSFNPPHLGHLALVQSFIRYGKLDECWITPTPNPPHKDVTDLASFEDRFQMCRLSFDSIKKVHLSRVEEQIEKPNYTLKTLQKLQKDFPVHEWVLCLGADSAMNFDRWLEPSQILEIASKVLIAPRPGIDLSKSDLPKHKKTWLLNEHKEIMFSSTRIRKAIQTNSLILNDLGLQKSVYSYIVENKLYGMD